MAPDSEKRPAWLSTKGGQLGDYLSEYRSRNMGKRPAQLAGPFRC
jgi:hypothetical protein